MLKKNRKEENPSSDISLDKVKKKVGAMKRCLRHGGTLWAGLCPARLKTPVPILTGFDDITEMY